MTADRHAWERSGVFEVAPGVHRIPLPLPGDALRAVNVYAVADGDHVVMIDGGWAMAGATELLERSLAELGYALADVREFLVTHIHRDHYTQAVAVRRITGSSVALGDGEQAALEAMRVAGSERDVTDLRVAGADVLIPKVTGWDLGDERADYEPPDRWLDDGLDVPMSTRTLRVIATPGHTVGHVVFHDRDAAALFAGDHVLPHITPSIGVQIVRPESPLRDYLDSLRLVLAMPDARLLPAHGPVTDSTHARVEELLVHHDERLTATAAAVEGGAHTGYEVASVLGWTRRSTRLVDLDTFNEVLAVNETMAHLQVLVERGWLRRTDVDGVAHFDRA